MPSTTYPDQGHRIRMLHAASILTLLLMLASGLGFLSAPSADAASIRHALSIAASMSITDDEFFSDEHCSAHRNRSFTLTSTRPRRQFHMTKGCGGEVRVELHLGRIQLLSSGRLYVAGEARLYEGTSESTTDLEHRRTFAFYVPSQGSFTRTVRLYNGESFGGDSAVVKFSIVNRAAS